jgi:hypothetical protein
MYASSLEFRFFLQSARHITTVAAVRMFGNVAYEVVSLEGRDRATRRKIPGRIKLKEDPSLCFKKRKRERITRYYRHAGRNSIDSADDE